jgi:hypothetical protein
MKDWHLAPMLVQVLFAGGAGAARHYLGQAHFLAHHSNNPKIALRLRQSRSIARERTIAHPTERSPRLLTARSCEFLIQRWEKDFPDLLLVCQAQCGLLGAPGKWHLRKPCKTRADALKAAPILSDHSMDLGIPLSDQAAAQEIQEPPLAFRAEDLWSHCFLRDLLPTPSVICLVHAVKRLDIDAQFAFVKMSSDCVIKQHGLVFVLLKKEDGYDAPIPFDFHQLYRLSSILVKHPGEACHSAN